MTSWGRRLADTSCHKTKNYYHSNFSEGSLCLHSQEVVVVVVVVVVVHSTANHSVAQIQPSQ